jgi:hypothetical protein
MVRMIWRIELGLSALRANGNHPVYGEMEITPADITEFVQNFSRGVRRDIP